MNSVSTLLLVLLVIGTVVLFLMGKRGLALVLALILVAMFLFVFTTRSVSVGGMSGDGGIFGAIADFFEGLFGGAKEAAGGMKLLD